MGWVVKATPRPPLPQGNIPRTHCIEVRVGPQGRTGRARKTPPPPGFVPPDRPERSKSLYYLYETEPPCNENNLPTEAPL